MEKHITTTLRQFAVYIANLFFLTSDAWAPVVSDADLSNEVADQYNLILVGSPLENSWVKQFHERVPLKYESNTLSLGKYYGKSLDKSNLETASSQTRFR